MDVERGVGYRMADKNKKPRDPIGVIPVDSIFSPVRKVSYAVEDTRVEQMTDRDRLILDVETDGSVTPREALASAGGTLLELVQLFGDLAEAPASPGRSGRGRVGPVRLRDHGRGAQPVGPLVQLPEARGHQHASATWSQKSEAELMDIRNFGQKSIDEVKAKLEELGLGLREE